MTCNLCGTQEATIHLTEIVNEQMIEIHLCENCAQEKGTDFKTHFNFSELLAGLPDIGKFPKSQVEKKWAGQCAQCRMTYEEFSKSGRLGCENCYEAFSKMLLPLIKRIQRSTRHVGKRPPKSSGPSSPSDLRLLQDRLRRSVQSEEFEEAARLRDEIKQVEEKMKKGRRSKSE